MVLALIGWTNRRFFRLPVSVAMLLAGVVAGAALLAAQTLIGPFWGFNDVGVIVPGGDESTLGARLGSRYEWKLSSDSVFTNISSAYLDCRSNTVESAFAVTTKLIGHLSWRGSLNVRYESAPPPPREQLDTLTRRSLVYAF